VKKKSKKDINLSQKRRGGKAWTAALPAAKATGEGWKEEKEGKCRRANGEL